MTDVLEERKFIKTKIRFFASFKQITNKREVEIDLEEGATIHQLLQVLFERYSSFQDKIFNESNELRKWIQILLNGRSIKFLQGLETKLSNGDIISLFPPVAGG